MLRRFIIIMTFLALLPLTAQAAKKKKGGPAPRHAASLIAVVGRADVSVDDGKTYKPGKLGQSVPVGGILRTMTGKMTLLLSEGSNVHLGENSEMTLKQHNPQADKGGSIFNMAKGLARFVVKKLQPGKSFEVTSSNAVAAVKGTDFVMELQRGGETVVKVFKTDTLSAVMLSGLDREKAVLLKENTQGGFDGKSFTQDKFEEKEQNEFKNKFEGLPVVPPQENADQGEQQGGEGEGSGEGNGEGGEGEGEGFDTDEIINDALNEFYDEVAADAAAESALRANDIAEGRVVYDRQGYQTQVFHLITRPDPYTVVNQAMSVREFGPNAGETFVQESTIWNNPLPDDWASVAGRALNHPDNLDINNYPIYYRTYMDFFASNPANDSLYIATQFYAPLFHCSACNTPSLLQQGYRQDIYLNGYSPGWYVDYTHNSGDLIGVNSVGGIQLYCSGCPNIQMTASQDSANGGWQFSYDEYNGGGTFIGSLFTQHLTLIDDNGNVFNTSGFSSATSPNDFRGADLHVEMTLSSDYFSQDIDLIFLQGFFDTFDMIQVPAGYSGCGGC